MRGRKPLPSALLAARAANTLTYIAPASPEMPRTLTPAAKETWDRLTPRLVALGVLTPLDGDALATYCETLERYQRCKAQVDEEGLTLPTSQGTSAHPLLAEMAKCQRFMRDFENDYGMRHLARARIKIAPTTEKKVDPFDAFLAENQPAITTAQTDTATDET